MRLWWNKRLKKGEVREDPVPYFAGKGPSGVKVDRRIKVDTCLGKGDNGSTMKFEHVVIQQLREAKQARMLSQQRIAQDLGISIATVYRWLAGKHQPSTLAVNMLEKYLKKVV